MAEKLLLRQNTDTEKTLGQRENVTVPSIKEMQKCKSTLVVQYIIKPHFMEVQYC